MASSEDFWNDNEKAQVVLKERAGLSQLEAEIETDRYLAWPGQALSYMIGQREILALRAQLEARDGDRFDHQAFHDEVIGHGSVLIGMGERTTYQAVSQVAKALFDHGAATRVIAAKMPKDRASMHLDTVFTFCDRDLVTVYQPVVDTIQPISYYPSDSGVDVVIEERGWIGHERFLHALNFCMLLPGPEAMQLATYVGWRLHGTLGGLVVAISSSATIAYSTAVWFLGDPRRDLPSEHFEQIPVAAAILFAIVLVTQRHRLARRRWIGLPIGIDTQYDSLVSGT